MKGGETPFHVWDWPVSSASLANSWVALLSSLFRCWKVLQLKTRAEDLISYIIWPRTPLFSLELTTRIRAKTSDSKIALEEPISAAKRTPWCKAKASVTEAGKANGSSLLRAPIVAPVWSQIIILILECSPSFVVAPSSLILWKPEEGGDQWALTVGWEGWSCKLEVVKLIMDHFAISQSWVGGQPTSLWMALFLFPQID